MTSREFCYWLQGFFEIGGKPELLTAEQTDMVRRHLAMVFHHEIDPSYGGPAKQAALQETHDPPRPVRPPPTDAPGPGGHGPPVVRC